MNKGPKLYDLPDPSALPGAGLRAGLTGGGLPRTYPEAAELAGMSEGTLLTHCNRVRKRHPELYQAIRLLRLAQLADRHVDALVPVIYTQVVRIGAGLWPSYGPRQLP